jgi:hypothetical protein
MTKLSLFLYAADALDAIDSIFIGLGVVACVITLILGICICCAWFDDDCKADEGGAWFRRHTIGILVSSFFIVIGSFTLSAAIPEKQTMYMIAGVEMANEFRQTDTAHELSSEMKSVLHDITGIIHSYAVEHGAQEAK